MSVVCAAQGLQSRTGSCCWRIVWPRASVSAEHVTLHKTLLQDGATDRMKVSVRTTVKHNMDHSTAASDPKDSSQVKPFLLLSCAKCHRLSQQWPCLQLWLLSLGLQSNQLVTFSAWQHHPTGPDAGFGSLAAALLRSLSCTSAEGPSWRHKACSRVLATLKLWCADAGSAGGSAGHPC